ncbi:flagellar motor switch protein FliG [Gryllotalpicola kribbensis]|jgi:flagellar motor switch protein FliG|uniref:Flagellar motor switch protein FliG n=1 Tax=Gryllotalpicola kribbensis TaxID=993084 RepID=A0ABP8AL37_9MICO
MPAPLSGTQKAAVVLMNLPEHAAASVLKQLTQPEAEDIAAEIVRLRRVDADTVARTFEEFRRISASGPLAVRGGRDVATGMLTAAFGDDGAAGLMGRVTSQVAGKAFEFLDDVEPTQIVTLLDGELPQTVALVLAHLAPAPAARVLALFDDEARVEIARRIATMSPALPEAVAIVAASLKARSAAVVAPRAPGDAIGGVQPLVEIINRSDAKTERAMLAALDERDPELAEEVRSRMLTFSDLVRFDPRDVQQVLRGTDPAVLAVALKGASEAVTQTVRNNLSEHNRSLLDEEVRLLAPVRASQVDEARATVVRAIRELEASGGITLRRAAEEDVYVD